MSILHATSLNLTRDPSATVVNLRPVPTSSDVRRHPSVYDRTKERRARLDMVTPTTVPLTFNGTEWSLIVAAVRTSGDFGADLADAINQQIRDALEAS